jgi:RNA polymerase sigma factor (sigma-70 family)
MSDDPTVIQLVFRAGQGDSLAWDELVERYAPLVWSVCRRHRLSVADSEDVAQTVWLRLVEHLSELREPAALPGWIATTVHRECLRLIRLSRLEGPQDLLADGRGRADPDAELVEEEVIRHERRAAARAVLAQLPPRCRLLLSMLLQDPPASYREIGEALDMPVGSIGPNRARCLDRVRQSPAFALLLDSELDRAGRGKHDD